MKVSGKIVDVVSSCIYEGVLTIKNGIIVKIEEKRVNSKRYIIPGFIDSHVHIESSMLTPHEFSRTAVKHGTIAVVSDPHEIANVLGVAGVEYMIDNSRKAALKIYYGAPSCVPATDFESSGAILGKKEVEYLLKKEEIKFLSEMMNYPGVVNEDNAVIDKIKLAQQFNLPIDGHAPALKGKDLEKYVNAGISTDHECFTIEEAIEKIKLGMKIQIREGSAAKNFESLIDLIDVYHDKIMFCSDDLHPDDLINGHMNLLVKRSIKKGKNLFDVLRAVSSNAIKHYNLDVGLIQNGDSADFIIVDNLNDFNILETWIDGEKRYDGLNVTIKGIKQTVINNFNIGEIIKGDIKVSDDGAKKIRVIEAIDGELITNSFEAIPTINNREIIQNIDNDILKIVVVNRYKKEKPAVGFIRNFGIKHGAIASSIAHDSHNIIAVGANDIDLTEAINVIIRNKGGICVVDKDNSDSLPLPIAGIMSDSDIEEVAFTYRNLSEKVRVNGSFLKAPFMTLSFMALIVIPKLKISNKGLFDVEKFQFVSLKNDEN